MCKQVTGQRNGRASMQLATRRRERRRSRWSEGRRVQALEEDGPEQRNCHSRRGDGNDGGGIHERDDEVYVGKPLQIPAQAQRTRTQGANTRNACTHRALFRTSQAEQQKRDGCGLRARSDRASRRVRGRRMGACIAGPHWASAHRTCSQARRAALCGRSHQAGRSGQWRCTRTSRTQHGDAC